MNTPINIPFDKEIAGWKKILEDFCQKNALLKYRLSEIVDNNEDKAFLQTAEYFQNELLLKDEKLKKLTKKLREVFIKSDSGNTDANYLLRHQRLREDITTFKKKYNEFSKEFNEKMLQTP